MLTRCRNPKSINYKYYGALGVEVRYPGFEAFHVDMGNKPPGCDIHRVNSKGHYEPGNCIWLEHSEHMRLTRMTP